MKLMVTEPLPPAVDAGLGVEAPPKPSLVAVPTPDVPLTGYPVAPPV
jgi:hypothetical protein